MSGQPEIGVGTVFSIDQINCQHDLVLALGELEALIEVCRGSKHLSEDSECWALGSVLMMATNKANALVLEQSSKLAMMEGQREGLEVVQ